MIAVAVFDVDWEKEPIAGGIRWRARMPRHDLITYEDHVAEGDWFVSENFGRLRVVACGGGEASPAAAKLRAVAVYAALVHDLKPST